jgi:surfeit locus 1 family protein
MADVSSPLSTRKRGLLAPSIFAALALAILLGLGTWQVERLQWKEALIERIDARIHAAPESLPAQAGWTRLNLADEEYRRVFARGHWEPLEALIFRGSGKVAGGASQPGYWVMGILRLDGGGAVVVNRGFVSLDRKTNEARKPPGGPVTVTGLLRAPEERNLFTPKDDPAQGQWYTRDPVAIAAALGIRDAAPFSLDEEAHTAEPGQPAGGATVIDIPNNHLSYAVTWYGLALTLVGVFTALVLKRRQARSDGARTSSSA